MSKITPIDRLFITISQFGNTRHNTELAGLSSFSEIVRYVRENLPMLRGLTTIDVRNATEGWSASRSVMFL